MLLLPLQFQLCAYGCLIDCFSLILYNKICAVEFWQPHRFSFDVREAAENGGRLICMFFWMYVCVRCAVSVGHVHACIPSMCALHLISTWFPKTLNHSTTFRPLCLVLLFCNYGIPMIHMFLAKSMTLSSGSLQSTSLFFFHLILWWLEQKQLEVTDNVWILSTLCLFLVACNQDSLYHLLLLNDQNVPSPNIQGNIQGAVIPHSRWCKFKCT